MILLAAVDFSEAAGAVLEQAAELARLTGAKLVLLHVARPEPDFVGYDVGPQHVRDHLAVVFVEEHRQLRAWADELKSEGIAASYRLVQGATAETILDQAEDLKADLIVVGSHGHGAVYDLLVGSVSESLLRKTDRPVVVVPARGHPSE